MIKLNQLLITTIGEIMGATYSCMKSGNYNKNYNINQQTSSTSYQQALTTDDYMSIKRERLLREAIQLNKDMQDYGENVDELVEEVNEAVKQNNEQNNAMNQRLEAAQKDKQLDTYVQTNHGKQVE